MKTTMIRLPEKLYALIRQSAERNYRSANAEIVKAIAFYLATTQEIYYEPTDEEEQTPKEK